MAYRAFDESKHSRDAFGRFTAAGGVVQRFRLGSLLRGRTNRGGEMGIVSEVAAGNRSPSAFQPRTPAAEHRELKRRVQVGTEVARGGRLPHTRKEEQSLHWASPRKIAMQRALTGDTRMPRRDAIQAAKTQALGFGSLQPADTVGTRRTFGGKVRRVRGITPPMGARPTVRGAGNLAKYSPDDPRLRPRAVPQAAPVDVKQELKGIRGRRRLEEYARRHGVPVSSLSTDAALRQRIIATLSGQG